MRNRINEVTQVRGTEQRATQGTGGPQGSLLSIRLNTGQRMLLGNHQRTKEQSERLEAAVLAVTESGEYVCVSRLPVSSVGGLYMKLKLRELIIVPFLGLLIRGSLLCCSPWVLKELDTTE